MHTALQNEDIFAQILDHISTSDDDRIPLALCPRLDKFRLATLLNVALTRSAFTEPTLDRLWRRIDDMTCLLRLLPSFQQFHNGTYYLDGPILDCHWNLLDQYAKRIQSVNITEDNIDPSVYVQLGRRNQPLLSSLRIFFTMIDSPALTIFASPSLRHVNILICTEDTDDNGFHPGPWSYLDTLSQVTPDLESMGIQFPVTGHALDSILKMKNLTSLRMDDSGMVQSAVNSSFFAKLGCLERLASLVLASVVNSPNTLAPLRNSANFSALTKLEIAAFLPNIVPLLQVARFPVLLSLQLTSKLDREDQIEPSAEESCWKTIFADLNKRAPSLKELRLYYQVMITVAVILIPSSWTGAPASASTFKGLLELNPTAVIFGQPLFDSLTNADVHMFAQAWPLLERLHLDAHSIGSINFDAFLIIAEHLPRLEKVGFSLQTSNLPDPDRLPLLQHQLRYINVCNSMITDDSKETFANCLLRLFPYLVILQHSFEREDPTATGWEEVQVIIGEIACRKRKISDCL